MSDQEWPSAPGSDEGSGRPPQSTPPAQPSSAGDPPPSASPPPAARPPGSPPPGSPSAPPPPPPAAPSQGGGYGAPAQGGAGQPADLGIRFGARIIDAILVGVVNAIISAVILFGVLFSNMDGGGTPFATFGWSVGSFIASLVGLAITYAYYVYLETTRGQTVGKMLLNLEVRNRNGGYPSPEQSLKRNFFFALSIIPFIGWLLQLAAVIYVAVTISQNPDKRGWHDDFGDTVVVRTR